MTFILIFRSILFYLDYLSKNHGSKTFFDRFLFSVTKLFIRIIQIILMLR